MDAEPFAGEDMGSAALVSDKNSTKSLNLLDTALCSFVGPHMMFVEYIECC